LPWIVGLFPALWRAWTPSGAASFHPQRFLLLWCAVVLAFFSASNSKLIPYVLPLFPALALLIGKYLCSAHRGVVVAQAAVASLLGIAAALAATQATRFASEGLPPSLVEGYVPWLAAAGLSLAAAGIVSAGFALLGRLLPATISLALGGFLFADVALSGHENLSPAFSAYHIVHKIRGQLKPDVPFYVVNTFDHTLLFYLSRTVTMVVNKDELAQPIAWEPRDYLPDTAAFARAWQADREAFALFNANDLDEFLKSHPVPMQIVARDARRVIVKKP
jgi:4-amino-4-deoxy-L-arabinose transferase-like glycosyltransferase